MLRPIPAAASFTFASSDEYRRTLAELHNDYSFGCTPLSHYDSLRSRIAGWEEHFTNVPNSKHKEAPKRLAVLALAIRHRVHS